MPWLTMTMLCFQKQLKIHLMGGARASESATRVKMSTVLTGRMNHSASQQTLKVAATCSAGSHLLYMLMAEKGWPILVQVTIMRL